MQSETVTASIMFRESKDQLNIFLKVFCLYTIVTISSMLVLSVLNLNLAWLLVDHVQMVTEMYAFYLYVAIFAFSSDISNLLVQCIFNLLTSCL